MTTSRGPGNPTDHDAPAQRPVPVEQPVEEWVPVDEPMTGPQRTYLATLAREAGEEVPDPEPSKVAASRHIERLQRVTGRIPADRGR
jgi:hypothetical protein